jgi:Ca-activated chloride channel family protein
MDQVCLPMLARLALLAVFAALSVHVAPVRAAEPPTVIVIFDGSGSMWGKLDGERASKLGMAREAVRQGLGRLASSTRVGLMSFGHRRGGDCLDTEMIVEPAPLDVDRIVGSLERLNPRGRGPLTKALRDAAAKLGPQSAPATVILIHDGADNCQQDPCSAAADLKAAHPRVRVDVVSVGVPPEEAATVACLPQSTGGKHYRVASAAETDAALLESLGRSASPTQAPPVPAPATRPAPAPAPPAPAASAPIGRPGLQLWTSLVKGGPPLAIAAHWTVRKAGEKGPPLWQGATAAPLLVLPTGRYEVEARVGLVTKSGVGEAVEGAPSALGLVLDAGTLALTQSPSARPMLDDGVVTLARIEAKGPAEPQILRHVEPEIAIPPGNYLIAITAGALRIERPVGIAAGERISIANSLNLGALELAAVAAKDGPPLDGLVYAVYEDDPDAPQGRREVARTAASAPRLKLPAGTYYVVARRGLAEVRDRVSVRTGEVEKRTMLLETGQVAVAVQVAGGRIEADGPIIHRLERLDIQPREVETASGAATTLDVAAGQYRLEVRIGQGNVRLDREFRLRPGETERVAMDLPAGFARFRLLDRADAKPVPDVSFEVRDRTGQLVWTGLGAEPRALLLAGRYTVRAEGRGLVTERPFDVGAGEERAVDLAPK